MPVACEVDVAVVGGSCTGVFAAVRAARLGMRTAVVERQNCFGGTATAGAVNVWHSLNDTEGRQPIIGGLTREVIDRLEKRDAVLRRQEPSGGFRLNTEELKIELDELVVEHGVRSFLHTAYCAPFLQDGRLAAVIVENPNGRQAILARQFVDATGNGHLAAHLGVPARETEVLQPPGTCAKIYGLGKLGDFDWLSAVREHGREFGLEPDWGWGCAIPGLPDVQMRADTHVFHCDTSNAEQLTRAEIEGRRKIRALMDIVRKYGPSPSPIALADLAATIGTRETPRRVAAYCLTGRDVLSGCRFADAIGNGSYPADIHHADGPGITLRYLDGAEDVIPGHGLPAVRRRWRGPLPTNPTYYQIPFRCLVQPRVPNVVLSGRMLDADATAFSAVRVMVNTNQTGEAAGAACALAVRSGCDVREVEPQQLRRTLAEGGSIVL